MLGEVTGLGKVYFAAASYLSASPGYYRLFLRILKKAALVGPLLKIRTPDACVLDSEGMPVVCLKKL